MADELLPEAPVSASAPLHTFSLFPTPPVEVTPLLQLQADIFNFENSLDFRTDRRLARYELREGIPELNSLWTRLSELTEHRESTLKRWSEDYSLTLGNLLELANVASIYDSTLPIVIRTYVTAERIQPSEVEELYCGYLLLKEADLPPQTKDGRARGLADTFQGSLLQIAKLVKHFTDLPADGHLIFHEVSALHAELGRGSVWATVNHAIRAAESYGISSFQRIAKDSDLVAFEDLATDFPERKVDPEDRVIPPARKEAGPSSICPKAELVDVSELSAAALEVFRRIWEPEPAAEEIPAPKKTKRPEPKIPERDPILPPELRKTWLS